MSAKQVCGHVGWGEYSDEVGPCPPPAEMVEHCPHNRECPKCFARISMSCTCDGARAINYATAVLGNYEQRG